MKVPVDNSGRIELPPSLQAQLGIKPGDEVELEDLNGRWVIRPVDNASGLAWKGNVLVHEGTCDHSVDELIDKIREERLQHLGEGLPQ